MIVTIDGIPEKSITKPISLVRGKTIRARHLGRDIMAGLKALVGGEIAEYTKLIAESREDQPQTIIPRGPFLLVPQPHRTYPTPLRCQPFEVRFQRPIPEVYNIHPASLRISPDPKCYL